MPAAQHYSRNPVWMVALVCCCLFELTGCSLFVMAGKMLQGDPVIEDEFVTWYGKSMAKSGKKVAVMCSTPEAVKSEFSSLDMELANEISRKMAIHEIDMVKPHKVSTWIDDHGGGDVDLKEFGADIDADLVVQISLEHFDFREENSPDLFRGRARGKVIVYELIRDEEAKPQFESAPASKSGKKHPAKETKPGESKTKGTASKLPRVRMVRGPIFEKTFDSVYPPHQPVAAGQMQADTFRKKFLDRVGDELSRIFYRHKPGADM